MLPSSTDEAEPSNDAVRPAVSTSNEALGGSGAASEISTVLVTAVEAPRSSVTVSVTSYEPSAA
ncbi:hypothetical protein [Salana multivorans]